jgi:hypothetical protein
MIEGLQMHVTSDSLNQFLHNRTMLLWQLTEINRQLDQGELLIVEQKRVITSLCISGDDPTEAARLLATLEEEQDKQMNQFGQLLDALDKIPLFEDAQS